VSATTIGIMLSLLIVSFAIYKVIARNIGRHQREKTLCRERANFHLKIVNTQLKNPMIAHFPSAEIVVHKRALLTYMKMNGFFPNEAEKGRGYHEECITSLTSHVDAFTPLVLKDKEMLQAAHRVAMYIKKETAKREIDASLCNAAANQISSSIHITQLSKAKSMGERGKEEGKPNLITLALEQADDVLNRYGEDPVWLSPYRPVFDELRSEKKKLSEPDIPLPAHLEKHDGLHRMWDKEKQVVLDS